MKKVFFLIIILFINNLKSENLRKDNNIDSYLKFTFGYNYGILIDDSFSPLFQYSSSIPLGLGYRYKNDNYILEFNTFFILKPITTNSGPSFNIYYSENSKNVYNGIFQIDTYFSFLYRLGHIYKEENKFYLGLDINTKFIFSDYTMYSNSRYSVSLFQDIITPKYNLDINFNFLDIDWTFEHSLSLPLISYNFRPPKTPIGFVDWSSNRSFNFIGKDYFKFESLLSFIMKVGLENKLIFSYRWAYLHNKNEINKIQFVDYSLFITFAYSL